MSWSRSVWLFCLDITYGQSRRGHYSIMSLSDWTMCHGQTYVYMAWTWHVALSNIKASFKLTTISHPVIDSSDIVLSLLLSLQRVHCSHVWVWVMHVGSVDVHVMILQYRRWSLYTTCPSYTHAYSWNVDQSFMTMTVIFGWTLLGDWMYGIVTTVTSDVSMPSIHLVCNKSILFIVIFIATHIEMEDYFWTRWKSYESSICFVAQYVVCTTINHLD